MKQKNLILFLVLGFTLIFGGCSWMGKTAGTISAKMEQGVSDTKEGYHEGYEKEKHKDSGKIKSTKEAEKTPAKAKEDEKSSDKKETNDSKTKENDTSPKTI